jgi:ubiquinone/menaquinone biosynthesis C-methylase UbiE
MREGASDNQVKDLRQRILGLSKRISFASPAMKPFVRFGRTGSGSDVVEPRHAWDFDHALQKKLLELLREIASTEDLVRLMIEQWKKNLLPPSNPVAADLELHKATLDYHVDHCRNRYQRILQALPTNATFLYIGCGRGYDCLALQRSGKLQITGIDSHAAILRTALELRKIFNHPIQYAAMDVMDLGFRDASFDGFLIEFYGFLPHQSQFESLQWNLARILKKEGTGFIVATRKKYASYWFMMGSSWPQSMVRWLAGQARLDFMFADSDGCEERLTHGLYSQSHTPETLSAELSRTFDVFACDYTLGDPRYVLATVRKREGNTGESVPTSLVQSEPLSRLRLAEIEMAVSGIDTICNHLESHATEVADYFSSGGKGGESLSRYSQNKDAFLYLFQSMARERAMSLSTGTQLPNPLQQGTDNAMYR